ncbi:MAG: sigma-70 family RNA polymerase sigma factor [Alistipes sp.]|jgi:RNA polymerase sigma-70 factor (ECF subfamily)|nr:sigma-70 family RNA polymerase sigma factor [Alistipes sp.]
MEVEKYIVASDADLVRMVIGGDGRAFEHLFDRYGASLHRLYLGRTGNADDTDDLIQEVFVKAFLNLSSYDARYAFGQWIYTIAKNTFIDYVRRRRDDLSIDNTRGEYIRQPASPAPDPEEGIIRSQQWAQFEGHLAKMSPKYRRLVELRFFKELSYEEIAAQLSLPLGTVKTQIHRARTQLCTLIATNG